MILSESHISMIFLSGFDKVAFNPSTPIVLEGQTAFAMQFFDDGIIANIYMVISANYNLTCRSNDVSYVILLLLQNGMSMCFFHMRIFSHATGTGVFIFDY